MRVKRWHQIRANSGVLHPFLYTQNMEQVQAWHGCVRKGPEEWERRREEGVKEKEGGMALMHILLRKRGIATLISRSSVWRHVLMTLSLLQAGPGSNDSLAAFRQKTQDALLQLPMYKEMTVQEVTKSEENSNKPYNYSFSKILPSHVHTLWCQNLITTGGQCGKKGSQ